ncbi:AraC family transcriptional regulator [Hymenobacter sp.]|jgi:AraC-like DNA-binding protein|uniref:AraC family transcriptional regulator n=1 Tax=Hymenobacter sp. TaxID=1898978 RepID=UPI002ED93F71
MYIQSIVDSEEKSLRDFALFKSAADQNTVINSRSTFCNWPTHADRMSLKFSFAGTEAYYVRHRKVEVEKDRFLVVNAGQPYSSAIRSVEWVHCLAIYFNQQLLQTAADTSSDEVLLANPTERKGSSIWFYEDLLTATPRLRQQLTLLRHHLEAGPMTELELEERLYHILLDLLLTHRRAVYHKATRLSAIKATTRLEIYRRLHLAREFIEEQAAEALTLDAIAEASMLSKNHLLRHFRELFCHSPHRYVTSVRLAKACHLLTESGLAVQEISLHTGFESPSSFGRLFKSVFTLSPQQYRLQNAG